MSQLLNLVQEWIFGERHCQRVTDGSEKGDIASGPEIFTDGVQVLVVLQLETDNDLVLKEVNM